MPLPSSGLPFVLFALGLVITVGGWLALMAVLWKYGIYSSFRAVDGLKRLFGEAGRVDRRKALVRIAIMVVGMGLLFPGIMMGDARRNAPCRDACERAGYHTGRFRGSPHDIVNGRSQGPYQCWCNHTEQDWAPEPLDVPMTP